MGDRQLVVWVFESLEPKFKVTPKVEMDGDIEIFAYSSVSLRLIFHFQRLN